MANSSHKYPIRSQSNPLLCSKRLRDGHDVVLGQKCPRRSAVTTPPGILALRPSQSAAGAHETKKGASAAYHLNDIDWAASLVFASKEGLK